MAKRSSLVSLIGRSGRNPQDFPKEFKMWYNNCHMENDILIFMTHVDYLLFPGLKSMVYSASTVIILKQCRKLKRSKQKKNYLFPNNGENLTDFGKVPKKNSYPKTARSTINILVVTDLFTWWAEVFSTSQAKSNLILELLQTGVFTRYGYRQCLVSDNGSQFTLRQWKQTMADYGI